MRFLSDPVMDHWVRFGVWMLGVFVLKIIAEVFVVAIRVVRSRAK